MTSFLPREPWWGLMRKFPMCLSTMKIPTWEPGHEWVNFGEMCSSIQKHLLSPGCTIAADCWVATSNVSCMYKTSMSSGKISQKPLNILLFVCCPQILSILSHAKKGWRREAREVMGGYLATWGSQWSKFSFCHDNDGDEAMISGDKWLSGAAEVKLCGHLRQENCHRDLAETEGSVILNWETSMLLR